MLNKVKHLAHEWEVRIETESILGLMPGSFASLRITGRKTGIE